MRRAGASLHFLGPSSAASPDSVRFQSLPDWLAWLFHSGAAEPLGHEAPAEGCTQASCVLTTPKPSPTTTPCVPMDSVHVLAPASELQAVSAFQSAPQIRNATRANQGFLNNGKGSYFPARYLQQRKLNTGIRCPENTQPVPVQQRPRPVLWLYAF